MTTEQGAAAMEEFGFRPVGLGEVGAPTPGRIADRLSDIQGALEDALRDHDTPALVAAIRELGRLRLALDAWDIDQMHQASKEPPHA